MEFAAVEPAVKVDVAHGRSMVVWPARLINGPVGLVRVDCDHQAPGEDYLRGLFDEYDAKLGAAG